MAITCALNVAVPCSCRKEQQESNGACQEILLQNSVDKLGISDTLIIVSASSVSMSRNRQIASTAKSQVSYLGIFVPPSLLPAAKLHVGVSTVCEQVRVVNDVTIRDSLASELLSSIHPFLLEHGKLVGIVSACREKERRESSAPPDMIIIDVSNAPQHWWHDIKASVNGEPIASIPTAVLKLIPLSTIHISTATLADSTMATTSELPTCAVCLHRIDPFRLGMPKPQNHQLCSKFCASSTDGLAASPGDSCRNQEFLRPWPPPSNCIACHTIHDRWKTYQSLATASFSSEHDEQKDDLFCHSCAMQETLWVCLTCGFVGCGRYSHKHAAQHYEESGHPYSLELATLRIWDYASSEFVQRGDLLQCPSVQRIHVQNGGEFGSLDHSFATCSDDYHHDSHASMDRTMDSSFQSLDKESPKKANMIGEEYEALLQSALEDQAQHYEGEITRLRAELTAENVDEQAMTKEEAKEIESLRGDIARFRSEIDRLSRQLLDAQAQEAGYRADSQRLLREQSVATELLDKIKEETSRENREGRMQVDDLEQQVADLTANLRMRQQFSESDELSNAQIFGTTGTPATPKSGKRGKKLRRMFRK